MGVESNPWNVTSGKWANGSGVNLLGAFNLHPVVWRTTLHTKAVQTSAEVGWRYAAICKGYRPASQEANLSNTQSRGTGRALAGPVQVSSSAEQTSNP